MGPEYQFKLFKSFKSRRYKMEDYRNCITVNPKIHFGRPYIKGTRITVDFVLMYNVKNRFAI
ncbi:MAG: DUF433 domain-containing protein [Candidatus Loosdrechtia sp.]|uniref:DUF433 domain-containing protein n=1 Tax=Candidatus Loosdrechtia sp. TaxID=3101272 RepID=UPI00403AA25B